MKKEFIPHEQALDIKELGFSEPCFGVYIDNKLIIEDDWLYSTNQDNFADSSNYTAPLYQQVFRWFREEYELSCSIELTDNSRHYYYDFTISDSKNRDYNDEDCFDSCKRIYDDGKFGIYEEAELECLKTLIEIVKTK